MARRRRPTRSALALRWLGASVLVLIAFAYVQPVRAYREARADVAERKAEVAALERERRILDDRLAVARTDDFIVREARKLTLVRPGERLFIVTGMTESP
jgi:cell division protein FtsB